jgi:hypothetical protein
MTLGTPENVGVGVPVVDVLVDEAEVMVELVVYPDES